MLILFHHKDSASIKILRGAENKKDLAPHSAKSLILLGRCMGLEPTTHGITIHCSTN
jgi:hypothetical protein